MSIRPMSPETCFPCITTFFLSLLLTGITPALSQGEEVFRLHLNPKPFHANLCKKKTQGSPIRIGVAKHRDLLIRRFEGQHIPPNRLQARTKDYTYSLTIEDLTNGTLREGAIAFRKNQAVIYTSDYPKGISRPRFIRLFPQAHQPLADTALNTFLRLWPIFNAAIDTCRPYPPTVIYGTDDEIDRIEAGRLKFSQMVQTYNLNPKPSRPLYLPESGLVGGFYDPNAGNRTNISYHALNPLEFYVPPVFTQFTP